MNPDKAEMLSNVALSIFRLNGLFIEWGNEFCLPHGLTSARWQVMGAIALAAQPPSVPQIAACMGITRQGVQKQVNLLIEEGIVQRRPNPAPDLATARRSTLLRFQRRRSGRGDSRPLWTVARPCRPARRKRKGNAMMKKIHPLAGALAIFCIAAFWLATVLSEGFGSEASVAWVKTAIPWGFLLLIPALMATGASGFALARARQ